MNAPDRNALANTARSSAGLIYGSDVGREVQFADVRRRVAEFGDRATLITVNASNSPHVVSTIVEVVDGRLLTHVGQRTAANLAERSALSLVWQPPNGGEYQLIVDGIAEHVDVVEGRRGRGRDLDRGHAWDPAPTGGPSG